jgi:hypothetical protein
MGPVRSIPVEAVQVGTIPLAEVSGLALGRDRAGRLTLVAIGDRSATIAWADVQDGYADLAWQTLDLRHAEGTRIPSVDPQLEALAVDGALGILLVQEHPNRAELIDSGDRRVRSHIILEVPDRPGLESLRVSWLDPDCSHAEGVVLLRGGHLLVLKEKDPAALMEFGPAGDTALGFGPGSWLARSDPWPVAEGEVTLELLALWHAGPGVRGACPDFSDAEVGLLGNLVLLSDQGRTVAVVPGRPPGDDPYRGDFEAERVWALSGIRDKPEGLAVLPDGTVLVACDRRKVKPNLFAIPRQAWDVPRS